MNLVSWPMPKHPIEPASPLDGKVVLITGGTGSFGRAFVERALKTNVTKIIVFSRDELKQSEMQKDRRYADHLDRVRYFIGDVRDLARLRRALHDVDLVISAAALKQVGACEFNPIECKRTNIDGAQNVIDAAIDAGVRRVLALSTDKATNPVNTYGASKLFAEKLYAAAGAYSGAYGTKFACVRYGNIAGSRGSVIPLFRDLKAEGKALPITHASMTRFWFTLDGAIDLVMYALEHMNGGELYVPHLPSFRVVDLAEAIDPGGKRLNVGIRPGEKLHESMIGPDEAHEFRYDGRYLVRGGKSSGIAQAGEYNSLNNSDYLDIAALTERLETM